MPRTSLKSRLTAAMLLASTASGCMVGPNYHRPAVTTPPAFKEAKGWSPAQPSDAADKKDWWTVFGDKTLNDLEERVNVSNQTLAADEAAYRAAHAIVAEDRAALFPTVTLGGSGQREFTGGGAIASKTASATGANTGGIKQTFQGSTSVNYEPTLGASWEPDLWGAVRRTINNAKATAQSDAALVANARLSLQTELASDYILLRQYDEEERLYGAEVAAYTRSLEVTQNQYRAGNVPQSDMLTAQTQLQTLQATYQDVARLRALMEHAIAVLVGVPPAELKIESAPWNLKLPEIPTVLPSELLQRRPDVAEAERAAAAANELIGVQIAAYYPTLTLTANGGFQSNELANLFNTSNFIWGIGASVSETVFDAGLRGAKVRQFRAQYDESVANYRETVLTAFQGVEDNLAAQRIYGGEQVLLQSAAKAATLNQTLTLNEYNAGTVDFTTVATAQVAATQAQISELEVESSRLATAVALIEALGGGWTTADLPKS
ncbi:MAG TPA: efflux transporter outer membrane subunit [Caulobacteraceae bacterium]|jgi:NodT family efflux transporter outer membrane factor (OMF) lipoprotein|nr:efflux transporter outer membrane subunit [Caulobacteraceae bacterium]